MPRSLLCPLIHYSNGAIRFASLNLSFPICETNKTAHVCGDRLGRHLEVQAHLDLFSESLKVPVLPAVGTQAVRCSSVCPLIHSFCYSTSMWCLSVYWTRDLTNTTVGEMKSTSSCVSYRCINSNVCNLSSHFALWSSSPCLHGEDSVFPTNRRTVGSSNETMYARPLPKSKELTYKCTFSPVAVVQRVPRDAWDLQICSVLRTSAW